MLSFDRACVLLGRRAHTHNHVLMNSCSRAPALMSSCYRSPTLSYRMGVGSYFVFLLDFAYLLVCSDSLPAPSSIPRESIRSLGDASRSCSYRFRKACSRRGETLSLENKGSPKPMASPRALREAPRALKEATREPRRRFKNTKIVLSHAHILIVS